MTVSTVVDHNDYTGNGVTISFPYTFRIFKKTDLAVLVVDLNENITVLALDTDYTVTNAGGYNGGNVVLTTPLENGWQISIARELEPTQETDLCNQGKFFAEVHEDALDKLTMLIQQVGSMFRLALRKPSNIANWYDALGNYIRNLRDPRDPQDAATKKYVDDVNTTNLSKTLRVPEPINELPSAANRANKMPAFDEHGNAIVILPPSGSASDVMLELAKPDGLKRIGRCQSVAELRTVEPDYDRQLISLVSHTSGTGYGGGIFYYDASDTVSADNNGTIVVTAGGARWKRKYDKLSIHFFGAVPGLATDQADPIQAALTFVESSDDFGLFAPKGLYNVGTELKMGANTNFYGDGIAATEIKALASLGGNDNVITTRNNTRSEHENYLDNVHLSDMTVNGNFQNRDASSTLNDGSCVHFTSVRNFSIRRVAAKYGILHNIDVSASCYNDQAAGYTPGDVTYLVKGPSSYGVIEDCQTYNSRNDDGITTHGSNYITIRDSQVYFDSSIRVPGSSQNGIEVDEGSFGIVVENCRSKGPFASAFQCKGHESTKAAADVTFRDCIADGSSLGIQIEHYTPVGSSYTPNGENVRVLNCTVRNLITQTFNDGSTRKPRPMLIEGYRGVLVEGLRIENIGPSDNESNIQITGVNERANNQVWTSGITIKNLTWVGTLTGNESVTIDNQNGLIHCFYALPTTSILNFENINIINNQSRPIIVLSGNNEWRWTVRDVIARGSSAVQGVVRVAQDIDAEGLLVNVSTIGFGGIIQTVNAGTGTNNNILTSNSFECSGRRKDTVISSGTPEGTVYAPQNTFCRHRYDGSLYRKTTAGHLNTGWKQFTSP